MSKKKTQKNKTQPLIDISVDGFDPLGLKSVGEISKKSVEFGLDAAREFLKLTCKPLLEELGLVMRDQFTSWKLNNIIKLLEKAKGKMHYDLENEKLVLDPRVAYQIIDHASVITNDTLQDMWAGLFASSCRTYEEDENILFIELLKRLTSSQVKLLNHLCLLSPKTINLNEFAQARDSGMITLGAIKIKPNEILAIMETDSMLKAETECTALESLGLLTLVGQRNMFVSFLQNMSSSQLGVKPTLLAISLYVKCQGSPHSPYNYFMKDLQSFYHSFIKEVIKIEENETLEFLDQEVQYAKQFDGDLVYNQKKLGFKDPSWRTLTVDELTKRLRAIVVFKNFTKLNDSYVIEVDKVNLGTFNYLDGFKSN
ncbi:hypothetical protein SAMN05421813_12837 [Daejeonella rubra]|uniref:DUF4393 domain-containing protein n=1 Tax=Daejeonella rubra TaxID=990371 RepID=A0A1G9X3Z0_9SPHI|nr:Abi-alpha family protein [Daejeonella rubra]SDM91166.1 hypothetical protein SAMN05421813_12837 [Daejeonella rubra]